MTAVPDLGLRTRTGGSVAFAVRQLGDRRVMVVEVEGEDRGAPRKVIPGWSFQIGRSES